jgi:CRP-like cAMP-binding protein
MIFKQGEPGDLMYIIKEGEVDILLNGKPEETVGPGGMVGEMALIDTKSRTATAIAKTDCQLVPISEKRFQFLVQQTPFFSLHVMRVLVARILRKDARC